jgi:hypothetical protein
LVQKDVNLVLVDREKCEHVTWLTIVAVQPDENEPPKVRQVINKIHRTIGSPTSAPA